MVNTGVQTVDSKHLLNNHFSVQIIFKKRGQMVKGSVDLTFFYSFTTELDCEKYYLIQLSNLLLFIDK